MKCNGEQCGRSLFDLLSVLVGLLIAVPPGVMAQQAETAAAQPGAQANAEPSEADLKLARSLFYDALELIDQSQWAQAADRL